MNTNPEVNVTTTQKEKISKLRIVIWIIGLLILIWGVIFIFPFTVNSEKPFFDNEMPLVIAHQGGEHLAPSNTLASFKNAEELGVDVIELDIHMTKDGHLVTIHDPTVDRTTDGEGRVNDLTLEEVQKLDAGEYFKDLDGNYSYRAQGVYIPTIEEVFEEIPNMRWNIEIKDSNDPELYRTISEKLWAIIKKYGLEDDVLFAAFDQDIIQTVLDVSDGKALVSGGREEIKKFVILHKIFLNGLYRPTIDAIQIPTEDSNINLKDSNMIRGAKRKNIDVHYWTINDVETMKELIELGANGIITDRPDLLLELLSEK